ncbi:hypothetical protein ACNTMW_26890 [Planosporangium sp. 12N6]|uniref:hypothetical protein n=1 Tax=Planosporangium spinosum TaxID=3402278 RepID=UPI003CF4DD47
MTDEPEPGAVPAGPVGSGPLRPPPYPLAGPRCRSAPLGRLVLCLAVLCGLLGTPALVAGAGNRWWPLDRAAMAMRQQSAPGAAPGAEPAVAAGAAARATVIRRSRVRAALQAALDAQAAALLRGDEAGFLAPVDAGATALVDELRRRFGVLRALRVAGWTETLGGEPEPVDGGWRVVVRIGYCFVVVGCEPVTVPVVTRWTDRAGSPSLVEFGTSAGADLGPRPWEVSDLRVAVGRRVLIAAPPRYADRLGTLLEAAEAAASIADRYARWSAPPGRYLVAIAGPDEWRRWYGVHQADWVAGYAMPVADHDTEIVLNGQRVDGAEVVDTLRHEFTHVVTLDRVGRDYSGQWWLVEGIAEYVRMVGRPLADYELLGVSRRYVRAGHATDVGSLAEPPADAPAEDAAGRYGIAFLTVRCLAERFGEERLLRFFDRVVRHGAPVAEAAVVALGRDWAGTAGGCAGYVRRSLT